MKRFFTILFFVLVASKVNAQCVTGAQLGTLAPTTVYQTVSVPAGAAAYYSFWGEAGATYTFTYCAGGGTATYDTYLTIANNTPTAITFNDDFCSLRSQVSFTPGATGIYRIYVSQFNLCTARSAVGTLAYIRSGGGATVDFPLTAVCGGTVTHSSTTVGAGDDCNISGSASLDRIYGVIIPQAGTYTINTCTAGAYDTRIVTTSGNCTGMLANNDDFCGLQSQVTYNAAGPGILYVIVEGFNSGSAGNYTLSITGPACGGGGVPVINASCASTQSASSTISTVDNCNFRVGRDQTIQVNIPTSGTWTFSTCGGASFDTYIFLSTGNCTGQIAFNDDACALQSTITVAGLAAGTYFVDVEGFSAPAGGEPFTLSVSGICGGCPPTAGESQANPIVVGAAPCASTPYTNTQTNTAANCFLNNYTGPTNQTSPNVWYRFTLPSQATVQVGHCGSGFDTYIHVWDGTTELAFNDDFGVLCPGVTAGSLEINLAAGTYYVISEGFSGNTGPITTQINVKAPVVTPSPSSQTIASCTSTNIILSGNYTGITYSWTAALISGSVTGFSGGSGTNIIQALTNNAAVPAIVRYTITPSAGGCNGAPVNVDVTVNPDATMPIISCPSNVVTTTNSGCTATGVALGSASASDACGGPVTISNDHPSSTYPLGITNVTWTAVDAIGNSSTCVQTVTVNDNINPTIICPANINTPVNSGCTATGVPLGTPTTGDNCTVASVTNNHPSTTYSLGVTSVLWTVTDGAGNTNTCTQLVTVTDNVNPTINCPSDISTNTNAGCSATGVSLGSPTTGDNCSVGTVVNDHPSTTFPLGTTIVTWTVTDGSGNTASCAQAVTITDNVPPTASNPADIILPGCGGSFPAPDPLVVTDEADNCSATVNWVNDGAPSIAGCTETTIRTYQVTDGANSIFVTQNLIRTIDTTPPNISALPATSTISCPSSPSFAAPTATDGCGTPALTFNDATTPGTCTGTYSVTRTWTATDGCGNSSTATQTINVIDDTPPLINCGAPIVVVSGCVPATYTATPPPASDACGGPVTFTNNHPGTSYPAGNTTIVWTATDACGNSSTCSQVITVSSPEADILGNGYPINHTSNIISLTNGTDFGNVPVCSTTVSRTYVIKNTGSGTLYLTGIPKIQLTGLNAADFSVIQPLVSSLSPGASVSFQVIFDPSASGYRNARVKVANNDCDESGYYYAIRGNGTACSVPIEVPDPSGQSQTSENNNSEEGESSTSVTGVENVQELEMIIYPNPSNGIFTVSLSELPKESTEIKVVDAIGQIVYVGRLTSQMVQYDLTYLRPGIYYLQIATDKRSFSKSFVITQKH